MAAVNAVAIVLAMMTGVLAVAWITAHALSVLTAERAMRARRTANPAVRREGVESAHVLTDRLERVRRETGQRPPTLREKHAEVIEANMARRREVPRGRTES